MITEHPWMWIIGGPNGAGKTTLAQAVLGDLLPTHVFVNTDEIARMLGDPGNVLAAGRKSIEAVERFTAARTSFAIETTLSSSRYLHITRRLRADHWRVGLLYVGLSDADIAVSRVAHRVATGGHAVPERDIRRRFGRSTRLLRPHAALCDRVVIFDNTLYPQLLFDGWRGQLDELDTSFPWDQEGRHD